MADPDRDLRLALLEVVHRLLSEAEPPIRYLADDGAPYVRTSAELRLLRQERAERTEG